MYVVHQIVNPMQYTYFNNIPVYDEYNLSFSTCDKFNKSLSNKTWPFKTGCRARSGLDGNTFNYFFSSVLVNTYHIHLLLQGLDCEAWSFEDAMDKFASELGYKYLL